LKAQNAEIEQFLKQNFVRSQSDKNLAKQLEETTKLYDKNSNAIRIAEASLKTFNREQQEAASEKNQAAREKNLQQEQTYLQNLARLRDEFVLTDRQRLEKSFDDKIAQIKGDSAAELELLVNIELEKTNALNEFDKKIADDTKAREDKRIADAQTAAEKLRDLRILGLNNELLELELNGQLTRDKETELARQRFEAQKAVLKEGTDEFKAAELQFRQEVLDINKKFDEKQKTQDEEAAASRKEIQDRVFSNIQTGLNIVTTLGDAFIKDEKKRIKFERNAAIAQIALNTATSIAGLVDGATKAASATGPAFPVTFALVLAGGLAAIFATIKKANDSLKAADATGLTTGGGGVNPGGITLSNASQTINPQPTLQQLGAFTQNEQGQFQVFVTETDISNVVNRVQVIESRAQFG
jgi:hypothetical protein